VSVATNQILSARNYNLRGFCRNNDFLRGSFEKVLKDFKKVSKSQKTGSEAVLKNLAGGRKMAAKIVQKGTKSKPRLERTSNPGFLL